MTTVPVSCHGTAGRLNEGMKGILTPAMGSMTDYWSHPFSNVQVGVVI